MVIWTSFKNYIWVFGEASFVIYWGLPEFSTIELLILYFSVGAFFSNLYIFILCQAFFCSAKI